MSRRRRRAELGARAALPWALCLAGCDGAFRSGEGSSGGGTFLEVEFEDGSSITTVPAGGVVELLVTVPSAGFERTLPPGTALVDPLRFLVSVDRDLGDPAAGGVAANTNATPFLVAQGWIGLDATSRASTRLRITLDTAAPIPFPVGLLTWRVELLDDIDAPHGPFELELSVRALDRPTLLLRLETPPPDRVTTGRALPADPDGVAFVGEQRPFALSLQGIPNPASGSGFDLLFPGGLADPIRLQLTADRDLGDPGAGGFAAGENLASLVGRDLDVVVDPVSGEFVTGALFAFAAPISPALGETTFRATITDDAGVLSDEQSIRLRVEPPVTLSLDVQTIYDTQCIFCHLLPFPLADLELHDDPWAQTVGVRSIETPDGSCAELRVAPYDPDASYLFHKVLGTHLGGCVEGSGDRMPQFAPPLADDQIATIERWILQGAHDD